MFQLVFFCALVVSDPTVTVDGETVIMGERGEMISLSLPADVDARYRWSIQGGFKAYAVDAESGTLYISMPASDVEVDLILAPNDLDKRIEITRYRLKYSGNPEPDGDDENTPTPDDGKTEEYDGPNHHGIGEYAWDQTRDMTASERDIAHDVFQKAAGHLRGYGGIRYIGSEVPSDSSDNVFYWLRNNLPKSSHGIVSELELLKLKRLTLNEFEAAFDEAIQAFAERKQRNEKT